MHEKCASICPVTAVSSYPRVHKRCVTGVLSFTGTASPRDPAVPALAVKGLVISTQCARVRVACGGCQIRPRPGLLCADPTPATSLLAPSLPSIGSRLLMYRVRLVDASLAGMNMPRLDLNERWTSC